MNFQFAKGQDCQLSQESPKFHNLSEEFQGMDRQIEIYSHAEDAVKTIAKSHTKITYVFRRAARGRGPFNLSWSLK
jgi:hypothetical protein